MSSRIGLAGEFRVMSELLLRGHNPAKSYLDNGIDLYLESNLKIQVKSASLRRDGSRTKRYTFNLVKKEYYDHKVKKINEKIDFLILWCIDEDVFFILPKKEIFAKSTVCIVLSKERERESWYEQYRNKWELLLQESSNL